MLIEGLSARGNFEPDKPLTRQEMAMMLMRACEKADCLQLQLPDNQERPEVYTDESDIAEWARQAVNRSAELRH